MDAEHLAGAVQAVRKSSHDIAPLILNRWSPRAMTGEVMSDEELLPLFEAARWAPSSYNAQPWRFIIARRQHAEQFERFAGFLVPGNLAWAKQASALVVIASRKRFEHNEKPSVTHTFDAGAAWENLALEASRRGIVVHGMEGFDYARAAKELDIPDDFAVLAMVAIGKRAPKQTLPEELRAAESPNTRRPLREILFAGTFGAPFTGA